MFISLVCWYIFCNIIYTQPFLEFCVISDGHRGVPLFHAILAGTEFSLRSQHLTVNPKLFKFLFQGLHDMTQWYLQNLSSQILVDIPTMKVSNSNAWVFRKNGLKLLQGPDEGLKSLVEQNWRNFFLQVISMISMMIFHACYCAKLRFKIYAFITKMNNALLLDIFYSDHDQSLTN